MKHERSVGVRLASLCSLLPGGLSDGSLCWLQGPVLRSIQRFGRLGRRSGQLPEDAQNGKDKVKEAKYMYLSIDEAGTHVNFRRFRCCSMSHLLSQGIKAP